MLTVNQYREVFVDYLKKFPMNREPSNLYDPVSYILTLKGKRLRPILTLMATDIFSNSYKSCIRRQWKTVEGNLVYDRNNLVSARRAHLAHCCSSLSCQLS